MTDRRWEYGLTYAASLLLPDLEQGPAPLLLQLGGVRLSWHDRFVRLTVSEDATYGIENSAYLVPTVAATPGQPPPVQPAAAPTNITFGFSRSAALTSLRFDRHTEGSVGVEYLLSGGLDAVSQQTMPQSQGPRATAQLVRTIARTDDLVTSALAQRVDFSRGPCGSTTPLAGQVCQLSDDLAQITEAIRHRLSRSDTVTFAAGAGMAAVRLQPGAPYSTNVFPVVEASYALAPPGIRATKLTLYLRYFPFLNLLTGSVLETASAEANALMPISTDLSMRLLAGVAQSYPQSDPSSGTYVHGELGLIYRASRFVDFGLGERWLWQEGQGAIGSLSTAYGLLSMTVRERPLHF
jgi:hypothetical protein